ncbi:MAG: hypothetical protein O2857_05710 [Planctomycetota bacterium]|nr:hypothetical protein [Planctomycetota bacterium]
MLLRRGRQAGLSLTELMAVTLIILILISLLFPVFGFVRDKSRLARCMNNLTQINGGLIQYSNDQNIYPAQGADLKAVLSPYVPSAISFKCPDDEEENEDSYSPYYVSRHEDDDASNLMLACPRHFGFEQSLNMTIGSGTFATVMLLIYRTHSSGDEEISAGQPVSDMAGLRFGEDVEVSPTQDTLTLRTISAFKEQGGTRHILISITQSSEGTISAILRPESRVVLEIATHAGLISTRGANLEVTVGPPSGPDTSWFTQVAVTSGSATLTPTAYCRIDELPGGFKVSPEEDTAYSALQLKAAETAKMVKD